MLSYRKRVLPNSRFVLLSERLSQMIRDKLFDV